MVSDDPISSRAEFLDDFFSPGEDESSVARYASIELATQKRNTDLVISDFQRVLDQIMLTLAAAEETFGHLLFSSPPARAPRYFQAVFLAFYKLMILDSQEIKNRAMLIGLMRNSGSSMNVGDGGGRWGAEQRQRTVNAVEGMYKGAFGPSTSIDPAQIHWITQLQNLLSQSRTEQSAYDFKQGFLNLASKPKFDEGSFIKILQTCVAIANIRRGYKGYVIVGVAETASTSQRVEQLFNVQSRAFEGFFITGIDHEVTALEKTNDQFLQFITDKIRSSDVSEPLRGYLCRHLKPVRYYEKTVYVFDIEGQEDPSNIGGEYFVRSGAQVEQIPPTNLPALIRRYILGS